MNPYPVCIYELSKKEKIIHMNFCSAFLESFRFSCGLKKKNCDVTPTMMQVPRVF